MIFEVATIDVITGQEDSFERGVADALPIFRRAQGFRSLKLERSLELPSRYRLLIEWDTLEDHVVHFRNSKDFQSWRSLVGHSFAAPPEVEHTAVVLVESKGALET